MRNYPAIVKSFVLLLFGISLVTVISAQADPKTVAPVHNPTGLLMLMLGIACLMLVAAVCLLYKVKHVMTDFREKNSKSADQRFNEYVRNLSSTQTENILTIKKTQSATEGTFKNSGKSNSRGPGLSTYLTPA